MSLNKEFLNSNSPIFFNNFSSFISSFLRISVSKELCLLAKSRVISEISLLVSELNSDILSSFCCNFSKKVFSREWWLFSIDFSNFDNLSELDESSVLTFWLAEANLFSIELTSDSSELLSSDSSFLWASFVTNNFWLTEFNSNCRARLSSSSLSLKALLVWEEFVIL